MDKYIIPLLLGLKHNLSINASAKALEAWQPDCNQIELANLIIEQLTNTETTDHVGVSEELADALMDPEISDLLSEAGALKIVNMLNMGKLKDSTTR